MRSLQAFTFLSGTSVTSGSSCEYKRFQAAKFEMQQTMNCTFLKLPTNSNGGESVASACDINVIYVVYRIYINTYLYTYVYRYTYVCIYMLIRVMLFVTCICDDVGFQHCLQQLKETVIEDIRTKNQLFFPYKKRHSTSLSHIASQPIASSHCIRIQPKREPKREPYRAVNLFLTDAGQQNESPIRLSHSTYLRFRWCCQASSGVTVLGGFVGMPE